MPNALFRQTAFDALVKVFAAGCDLDRCDISPEVAAGHPAQRSLEVAAEKLDELQDLLSHLAGVSIDDVRDAFLASLSGDRVPDQRDQGTVRSD